MLVIVFFVETALQEKEKGRERENEREKGRGVSRKGRTIITK